MDTTQIIIPEDRRYIESVKDEILKDAMYCSVVQHRVSDSLTVGDAMPDMALPMLDGQSAVKVGGARGKPLMLIFGSYT